MTLKLIAAGSAVALALGGAGAASAQPAPHLAGIEGVTAVFDSAVAYLQIDKQSLAEDLKHGQSLAQIADAQGKTADGLVDTVVTATRAQLDVAVAAGKLSSAKEQAILAKLRTSLGTLVTKNLAGARQVGTQRPRPVTMFLQPLVSYMRLHIGTVLTKLKSGQSLGQISITHGTTSIAGGDHS